MGRLSQNETWTRLPGNQPTVTLITCGLSSAPRIWGMKRNSLAGSGSLAVLLKLDMMEMPPIESNGVLVNRGEPDTQTWSKYGRIDRVTTMLVQTG